MATTKAVEFKVIDHTIEVNEKVQKAIDKALEICGQKAESYAVMMCPVDTSTLKNSITHEQIDSKSEAIGTPVSYAPYVEFGHHQTPGRYVPAIGKRLVRDFVPPKPFLVPAIEDHKDEYQDIFKQELGEIK